LSVQTMGGVHAIAFRPSGGNSPIGERHTTVPPAAALAHVSKGHCILDIARREMHGPVLAEACGHGLYHRAIYHRRRDNPSPAGRHPLAIRPTVPGRADPIPDTCGRRFRWHCPRLPLVTAASAR